MVGTFISAPDKRHRHYRFKPGCQTDGRESGADGPQVATGGRVTQAMCKSIYRDVPEALEQLSPAALRELEKDAKVGRDILTKATKATWCNWAGGSTLIFWWWPVGFQQKCARDGMPAWIHLTLPRYKLSRHNSTRSQVFEDTEAKVCGTTRHT
jgi:hypothetical protein